ncbi:peptidoglycan-binding domain-containing protein [Streptomyces sp. TRM68416]|uniref:peptidoglycan-binding domain-containing protein n=1 Tax=Streptomyces sp. TRM68416 TaxID=2758412 RepID=UPI0016619677|nr:peptidoglycan-binding domain-containing protein [Streptomyces sp. TRM68416]MBD0837350.1 peptidoglycan-binding protein [Streptomyces sp. TRM68416]
MTDPKGHTCPECGAPRGADNTPSCDCTQRASEALRDARTAEAAAAEDFDPLRIRPYVELEGTAPEDTTRPLAVAPDLNLFETPGAPEPGPKPEPEGNEEPPAPRGSRRRRLVLASAAAAVAILGAAGMASGLFDYDTPTRNTALPEDVRAGVPDTTTSPPASKQPSPTASASTPLPPSPAPTSAPPPTSALPTPASPSASGTPSPAQSAPTARASDPQAPQTGAPSTPPVLRRGDRGPEVTELQLRLNQLYLYFGDAHGTFDNQVEDALKNYQWTRGVGVDELGVYNAETRTSLESETSEP